MVLAFAAFLAVAGPGVILAAPPAPSYARPIFGDILGTGLGPFSMVVHFSTDPGNTEEPVSGTFSCHQAGCSINPDGTGYVPATGTHKDLITATFSNSNGAVHVSKLIIF